MLYFTVFKKYILLLTLRLNFNYGAEIVFKKYPVTKTMITACDRVMLTQYMTFPKTTQLLSVLLLGSVLFKSRYKDSTAP